MPKLPENRVPKYCLHRASGQASVTLSGRTIYLGTHGTADSRAKYKRLVAEWIAAGRNLPEDQASVTVVEVAQRFRAHAKEYYRRADGSITSEVSAFDTALRPLLKLYGRTRVAEFDLLRLKATREQMIDLGWARKSINKQISRIRHVFRWAVEEQLVAPSIYHGLLAVAPLKAGRSGAAETEPVGPVPLEHVEATKRFLGPRLRAMVDLQLLSGCRPGELLALRTGDIDTRGKLWLYSPGQHKNVHRGHKRTIFLGPRAIEILRPLLKTDLQALIFTPAEAERERRDLQHAQRKTPLSCGNRPGSNRARKPAVAPGDFYTIDTYRRAIRRAADRADAWAKGGRIVANDERVIPRWSPNQLRHTAATRLRHDFGIEAAQVILGHKHLNVTEIYAEKNVDAALRIMSEVG